MNGLTIFEEYRQKMSGKGVGFLEFYLWIFCPLLTAYHIYNIVRYAIGKQTFEAGGFLFSLLIASVAVLVVATGLFLNKTTFWIDIALPVIYIFVQVVDIIEEVILAISTVSGAEGSVFKTVFSALGGIFLFANIIVLFIFAIALFYFIDHKDVYGY